MASQKLNRCQVWWSLLLSQYELKLVHVSESQMVQSDVLSQRPDWVLKEDTDNEDQILLPVELFV